MRCRLRSRACDSLRRLRANSTRRWWPRLKPFWLAHQRHIVAGNPTRSRSEGVWAPMRWSLLLPPRRHDRRRLHCCFCPRADAQLLKNVMNMNFDCSLTDEEFACYLAVRETPADELENFGLAGRQQVFGIFRGRKR